MAQYRFLVFNRIREYRLQLGLTQSQLADEIGVSKNAISDFEVGNYDPRLEIAIQLAQFFNCPLYPGLFYTAKDDIYVYSYDDQFCCLEASDGSV